MGSVLRQRTKILFSGIILVLLLIVAIYSSRVYSINDVNTKSIDEHGIIHEDQDINEDETMGEKKERQLRVLAIGNSFSRDCMEYLYKIAKSDDIDDIVLGIISKGNSSIEKHWNMAMDGSKEYDYYKNINNNWVKSKEKKSTMYGIRDEEWDIITLQQESSDSGIKSTYDYRLLNLANFIKKKAINDNVKLAWNMTWAYQQDYERKEFSKYNRSQITMYNGIVDAVRSKVLSLGVFDIIIPTGTAIQNVRTSVIGDVLTRDGFHLTKDLGRYIAGLSWYTTITGRAIDEIEFDEEFSNKQKKIIKESINAALIDPYKVTRSSFSSDS